LEQLFADLMHWAQWRSILVDVTGILSLGQRFPRCHALMYFSLLPVDALRQRKYPASSRELLTSSTHLVCVAILFKHAEIVVTL